LLAGGSSQRYSIGLSSPAVMPEQAGTTHGACLVGTAAVRAGVQYALPFARSLVRFGAGYLFGGYWFGAVGHGAASHALFREIDLLDHGPFARCEISF
jgi:hypothetical protein